MSTVASPALALALPFAGAFLIAAAGRWPNSREAITLLTAAALFGATCTLVTPVLNGARPEALLVEMLPGLVLALRVEPLGMLFALVASALWIINSIYSIGYMRANREANQTRFYVCFALALASTIGIAFAANLVTLFVFYEALTLCTYPLVTHHGTPEARRAGRTYLGVLLGTSTTLFLLAMVWTWALTGTLDFRPGGILAGHADALTIAALLALYMFGTGKAALMPFHRWLPAAMVAPAPVSALLHAVAVVKAGVFTVVKVLVYVFGVDHIAGLASVQWLPVAAGVTILLASITALRSDNLKRRLAYSTVSQLSYVILAAALLTRASVAAAALHIAAHALGKITLFFAAGAIYTASHKTEVSQLAGVGRRMPITMTAFGIGALSMIGLPPTAGFISKWYLLGSSLEAQQYGALAVAVVSTLLNAAYLVPIVYAAFLQPDKDTAPVQHGEAPWPMLLALALTAGGSVALFFFAGVPLRLAAELGGG